MSDNIDGLLSKIAEKEQLISIIRNLSSDAKVLLVVNDIQEESGIKLRTMEYAYLGHEGLSDAYVAVREAERCLLDILTGCMDVPGSKDE